MPWGRDVVISELYHFFNHHPTRLYNVHDPPPLKHKTFSDPPPSIIFLSLIYLCTGNMYRGRMHACFKLDIEQAHSQAFQLGGTWEGGTTGESKNVGGGREVPSQLLGGDPAVQKPLENPGKCRILNG